MQKNEDYMSFYVMSKTIRFQKVTHIICFHFLT